MTLDDPGHGAAPEDRLSAAVRSIGQHARSVNRDRAARLGRALTEVAGGSRDEALRCRAAEVAHQLVGSAGTFGFTRASELAGELERYFADGDLGDPARLAEARDLVRRLTDALAAEPDYQPDDEERDPTS